MKVEFHIHTKYSKDSNLNLKTIQKTMKKHNIIPIITDHDTIKGALIYKKKYGNCIMGQEITTSEGEIIGLFLKKGIKPGLTPEQTSQQIKKQGGLIYIPHPFDTWRTSTLKTSNLEIIKPNIIEIFNRRTINKQADANAQEYALSNNITQAVGTDTHTKAGLNKTHHILKDFNETDLNNPKKFLKALKDSEYQTSKRAPLITHIWGKVITILKKLEIL